MVRHQYEQSTAEQVALGLGWFSIALGLGELAAPHTMARAVGLAPDRPTRQVMRAMGLREIGHGLAILTRPGQPGPVWSRVAGDGLDVALFAAGLARPGADSRRGLGGAAFLMAAGAADLLCARALSREARLWPSHGAGAVHVEYVATISKPIDEVYRFWRDFENFPRFMRHVESVEVIDATRSRWRAKAPAGMTVEWEAEIITERENEAISWRSVEGADVENHGSVTFEHAPGARGTEVRVELSYIPPAGELGRVVAKLFGEEPEQQVRDDLRRFKQLMETGEIPLSDGPGLWRPAQPAGSADEVRSLAGVRS